MKMYSFSNSEIFERLIRKEYNDTCSAEIPDKMSFKVAYSATGEYIGNLVDISTSGIMIVSESALSEKTIYRLNMEFLQNIRFDAVCAWTRDIGTGNFISGLEFTEIGRNDLSTIEDAIDRFKAEES